MAYLTTAELRSYLDVVDSDTFVAETTGETLTLSSVRVRASLTTAQAVEVSTTGTLPAPLAVSTAYYVILGTDQAIQLATTSANAAVPTAINLTTAGTGTHTITKSINDTTLLEDAITAAVSYVENRTNRVFEAATDTKYYDHDAIDVHNSRKLHVADDLMTITELLNGDSSSTEITSADYTLLPRNSTPYHQILLMTNGSSDWEFDTDYWVAVTGTWGYSTTPPADIKRAVTVLAAYYYHEKERHIFDTTAIPEAGVITIPAGVPATVTKILRDGGYQEYL